MANTNTSVKRKRIGASKPYYAKVTAENVGTYPTYGEVKPFSEFVALTESIQTAESKFHSNNRLSDDLKVFKQCDLTFENDGLSPDVSAEVFGLDIDSESGELKYGGMKNPPFIGFAFFRELMGADSKRYYEGVYYPKCKAFVGNSTDNTRGENIDFKGDTVNMCAYALDDTDETWKIERMCETEAEAEAWCKEKLGFSVPNGEE